MKSHFQFLKFIVRISVFFILTACGIVPSIPIGGYANKEASGNNISHPEQRVDRAQTSRIDNDPTPNVFVGVGISGGGSRAAVFGAAIMHELDRLGMLDHVKVISSVSGGGLPAAAFALDGSQIISEDDWGKFIDKMSTPFLTKWAFKQINPLNAFRVAATDITRTDLMADILDDELFHQRTYGTLGPMGPRKPALLISATDTVGEPGGRFVFDESSFSLLLSDLTKYPISRAVMASAAFPGVFNPVTVRRFPTSSEKSGSTPGFTIYHHLIDGGPSDNLGIDALLTAARSYHDQIRYRAQRTGFTQPFSCILILADAYPISYSDDRGFSEKSRRGTLDYFIDTSFVYAFDSLLARRRAASLQKLGIDLLFSEEAIFNSAMRSTRNSYLVGEKSIWSMVYPYNRVVTIDVETGGAVKSNADQNPAKGTCLVWHLALSQVNSVPHDYSKIPPAVKQNAVHDDPILVYRQRLWRVVNQIPTSFNLSGPKNCSTSFVQRSILDAAHILVQEDSKSKGLVCEWFRRSLPNATARCTKENIEVAPTVKALPLKITSWPKGNVECLDERSEPADK